MTDKTIQLNSKAFGLLEKLRKKGETFSDIIIRLTAQSSIEKLLQLFGALEEVDDQELEAFKKAAKEAWS